MRRNPHKADSFVLRVISTSLGAITLIGMVYVMGAAGKTRQTSAPISNSVTAPVTVGIHGNEPIVLRSPDGTLYISALQHIYRSTDSGTTWTELPGPIYASQLNLNSDSSISVDPGNRLYFTFDYPYAGTTAVCTSDDHGDNWSCDPAVVPGGTDRMWVFAPTNTAAYEVTNQGLYETTFLTSTDRGSTWTPKALGAGLLEPQTGPLLQKNCSNHILQITKIFGTLPSDVPELKLYVYNPSSTTSVISDVRGTGLGLPTALPSAALDLNGELWVVSEEPNAAGGRQVVLERSADEGVTWTKLPPIPGTTTGTATFTWVAAGAPGHIGVIYYYTSDNAADPGTLTTSTWNAVWAESYNADATAPTWTVTTIENTVHIGAICAAAGCMGTDRFAGDFITAIIDSTGAAHLTWMTQQDGTGAISIRYQQIESAPPSTFVPLPCSLTPTVVSRKTHGSAGTFDINLPLIGSPGIECRKGQGTNSDEHQVVFTFGAPVTFASATCGETPATTSNSGNAVTVNCASVPNAQTINVTLTDVSDGTNTGNVTVPMSVLLGDTSANGLVNSTDVSQTQAQSGQAVTGSNFRADVSVNGLINSTDVSLVQSKSGTGLP